ncbi:hypothetical protein BHM03_00055930 [Ensete ventricosum]|nr:hypothetical protein BHM03_00055930 [Ensete ventricosum]
MITTGCDQGGWQKEVTIGSVGQRKMCATVEGIREIGRLKDWWTKGFGFWVRFVVVLGANWGCNFVKFRLRIGMVLGLGRQQINGSAIWWATSKAIVGIACEGGGMDDGYRGSNVAALIPDDRTPKGAL